jgi:uncharacterized protein YjbI with pentapeptide repeats
MDEAQPTVPWEEQRCAHADSSRRCTGIVVASGRYCLAHTTQAERDKVLTALAKGGVLSATRGVPINDQLLQEILQAVRNEEGTAVLLEADFSQASFEDIVAFKNVRFVGSTSFDSARFMHAVFVWHAHFEDEAYFSKVHFSSNAFFVGVRFGGRTLFQKTLFDQPTKFDGSVFEDSVSFYGAQFTELSLRSVSFCKATNLGPLLATERVDLAQASFDAPAIIDIAAKQLSCVATTFRASTLIRARHALIVLDLAEFQHHATVCFAELPFDRAAVDLDETPLFPERLIERLGKERPSLISLRQVDASQLTLAELNLASCFFHGAFNLDKVRIEGARPFGKTPHGIRYGWTWPPFWRWTSRYVLVEEQIWRASEASEPDATMQPSSRPKSAGWEKYPAALTSLSDDVLTMVTEFRSLNPGTIATL